MPDASALIVAMLVSVVGLALFVFGKKQSRPPQLAVGLLMMVYPYFISTAWVSLSIGALLLALMALAIRAGA